MKHLFGPIPSRRLGSILGLDIIPFKTCSFNCIYCELGPTEKTASKRRHYDEPASIVNEVVEFLSANDKRIDYIAFTGSGEPTLNADMGIIADALREKTGIPLALVTNASLFYMDDVRRDAMSFDIVLPSLDSFDEEMFARINRPDRSIDFNEMMDGLRQFSQEFKGSIFLEIMLVKNYNDSDKDILKLRRLLSKLRITKLQINTVIRPPAEENAEPINEEDKRRIKHLLGDIANIETVFHNESRDIEPGEIDDVIALLSRRPCTFATISSSLGIPVEELRQILQKLEKEEKLRVRNFNDEFYYRIKNE